MNWGEIGTYTLFLVEGAAIYSWGHFMGRRAARRALIAGTLLAGATANKITGPDTTPGPAPEVRAG